MASKRTWSEYYINELEESDKPAYEKKLTLNNGLLLPDPYSLDASQWSSEESLLPDITFADITFYLIETPSEFTRDKICAYKSLEAYNFFVSGHVNDVYIHKVAKSDFSLIKSSVLPSKRQGQKETLYNVWVSLHKTGWILSANCTCMAG